MTLFNAQKCGRLVACMLALAFLLVAPPAQSQTLDDALAKFAEGSFNQTEEGITGLVASGSPRALAIIQALQAGQLFFDPASKKIFIRQGGRVLDAATGAAVDPAPADLTEVRIINRLRRALDAAIGGLTLMSADPRQRLASAQAVFKSREASVLPALDAAIAKETESRIRRALEQARAAIILYNDSASEVDKIDAIGVIRDRGDQESIALLSSLPANTPPAVKTMAQDAITGIQNRLAFWEVLQNAWYGLSLGSVLLLAAIGLAITFGVMGVINMAHGEMVMIGAYVTFVVQETIRIHNPALFDYSLAIAIPLAFLLSGAIGILIERTVIQWLYGRPLDTLLATWGISLILQQAVRTMFGPTNREVGNPSWMSGAFEVGQITITYNRMWIIVFTMAVFFGSAGAVALHAYRTGDAGGDAEPAHGGVDGHQDLQCRYADLRPRLGNCRTCRGGAVADRQCLAQSRTELHHRLVHGRGVRRRRQSLGHAGRRILARHRQQVPRTLRGCGGRQDRDPRAHHPVHPEAPARPVRAEGPGGGGMMTVSHRRLSCLRRGRT